MARLLAQARAKDPTTEVIRVEAATYEAHQLDTLVSPSLFGEPRLVLVPALEQMTDALLTDLLAYVDSAAASADPEVSVVLRHNGGQRGRRLLEAVGASGYPVVSCPPVKSPRDKSALVSADVARAGRRIEPEAVGALVDALGSDLRELCSAVDQLLADTQGTISAEHVSTYYAGRIEATGFTVADAAAAGSTSAAITALRHAVATGTDPVVVVAALATKVRQLARVAASGGRRMTPADLGMAPWQVDRARRELSGWSDDALATAIVAVAKADAEVKGGSRDAVYAVERAVLTVCRARSRGTTARR
ncbi:DNA polymerase III subunit delta [Actinomyces sp. 2119]|uniref:DNA-directed DNA polymerase n=1 Tax=Actinomyces lilanjuaniae TaxID=2321394 RepID=A0ABM6Z760_9ACTO|nr:MULTISPECIES: DNA polymerase III subunit delta [Actinomyces]AYD90895.1 DNA polymerase III subunit delta [Actinomyces lilanjuaniae]RJF42630.1 DNA polymerase III subunit delta [Actinomyces sp. 2119]